jgi:hypothetical protein
MSKQLIRYSTVKWTLILLLGALGTAEAAPVNELELDGTAVNNTGATAQVIPGNTFTLPVPDTVFDPPGLPTATLFGRGGGFDVDFYRISGSGQLLLDVDNEGVGELDTFLSVFNSAGALIAFNDDASIGFFPDINTPNIDLGSEHSHDSRIFITLPGPGNYFVAVTRFGNEPCGEVLPCNIDDAFVLNNQPQPDNAIPYRLHISLETPTVPAPPTLLLLAVSGLVGLGSAFWRRRRPH